MSIVFSTNIDIERICPESEQFSDRIENNENSNGLSIFDLGLAQFCYDYNCKILMLFGNERKEIFLYPDIYYFLVFDLIQEIRDLKKRNSFNIGFADSRLELDSCEYYGDKVNVKLTKYGNTYEEYFTESVVDELIHTLIKLPTDIISLAVKVGYVDLQEANDFLIRLNEK